VSCIKLEAPHFLFATRAAVSESSGHTEPKEGSKIPNNHTKTKLKSSVILEVHTNFSPQYLYSACQRIRAPITGMSDMMFQIHS
jgi:hypothetical protein